MKTVQIRRYALVPDMYDEFLAWWDANMPKLRTQFGFAIEFGYGDRAANEFVWAVSVDGDQAEFERRMDPYMGSPERAAVFAENPERMIASVYTGFVDVVADAAAPAHPA